MADRSMMRALVVLGLLLAGVPVRAEAMPTVRDGGYNDIRPHRTETLVAFRYAANPDIIILDVPTLAQQGAMFNRTVALIERAGASREQVMTDAELAEYIRSVGKTAATFAFGNDFRVSEMVVFFNRAAHGGIALNSDEQMLRQFLLGERLVVEKFGFLRVNAPDRVILSIPQEQSQPLDNGTSLRITAQARDTILRHELSHAEFYTNRFYADYCRQFWRRVMSEQDRAAFRRFLGGRNYDTQNEEMMINETQAYLMHTLDPGAFSAKSVGLAPAALERLRQMFMEGNPPTALFSDVAPQAATR